MSSSAIPDGAQFLPGTSRARLESLLKASKNKKERSRLRACIKRKSGRPIIQIARDIGVPYTTVHRWLQAIAGRGLDALRDKKPPGSPCRLDEGERRRLARIVSQGPKKHGFEGKRWTAKMLNAVARDVFNVDYTERGMQLLLRRNGLSGALH